jgi:RNA polymerase sigma-70 factor (ECF subfamily)
VTRGAGKFDVLAEIGPLTRFALSLTRDADAAEDLVQETLARAYEKRHLFNTDASLRTWLFSVLHSVYVSSVRRRSAEARREKTAFELAPTSAAPDQEHAADLRRVQQALDALPSDQKAVLHLVAVEGFSYREAADTLGVPVGTIMSRLARGRSALRLLVERRRHPSKPQLRVLRGKDEP